jgi:hypothetical protein|tara:strand:+ start:1658 stop:1792 length:135 start_codon:yes stop_codon:yes gene_type:complete
MFNKKAVFISPADWIKGFVIGLLVGAILIYLIAKGIIPIFQSLF